MSRGEMMHQRATLDLGAVIPGTTSNEAVQLVRKLTDGTLEVVEDTLRLLEQWDGEFQVSTATMASVSCFGRFIPHTSPC